MTLKKKKSKKQLTAQPTADKQQPVKLQDLQSLLQLLVPHLQSKFGVLLASYAGVLMSRVFITTRLAEITGELVTHMAARDWDAMFHGQVVFGLTCFVASGTTTAMKVLEKEVALEMRSILFKHLLDRYLDAEKLGYVHIDLRDASARLTVDLQEFSNEATHVLGHFLKPAIDVLHLTVVMCNRAGVRNVAIFYAFFAFVDFAMKRIKQRALERSMKEMATETQFLEAELRTRLGRIDHYREQIALQRGTEMERKQVGNSYSTLHQHLQREIASYALIDVISSYLVKYGGLMVSFSLLTPAGGYLDTTKSAQRISGDFMTNSSLLGALASAVKDLGDSLGMMPRVRGLSARVAELTTRITALEHESHTHSSIEEDRMEIQSLTVQLPRNTDSLDETILLTRDLSITIKLSEHTVISGENGCGKSSLLRTVAGLWEPYQGTVLLPTKTFFVPQDTYFTVGPLLEQMTYPREHTELDEQTGRQLMDLVGLQEVSKRYASLKQADNWNSVLSGGERQRLALARLFFHARAGRVNFAICDEPLSAVSKESIRALIDLCKQEGVTLVTVSHSAEIDREHDKMLRLERGGAWQHVDVDKEQAVEE